MSVSTSTAAVRLQELCDHILEFVNATGRIDDLKACALSSRNLSYSAQSHLFRDIILYNTGAHAAAVRLCSCLTVSPHLIPYIRRLTVRADPDILTSLSMISFSGLNELKLYTNQDTPTDRDAANRVASLVRDLIGLPSLRRVEMINPLAQFEDLEALFSSPTLAVTDLFFNTVLFMSSASGPSTLDRRIQRPAVKSLKLVHSPRLAEWFVHPGCPFDVSRLVDVDLYASMTDNLHEVLTSSGSSLERLKVDADGKPDTAAEISLHLFPALTYLHLTTNEESLEKVEAILSQIATPTPIDTVIVGILETDSETIEILQNLDPVVANLRSPRRFEIRLEPYADDERFPRDMEMEGRRVKDCFPQIFAKGILCVTHYRSGERK
ncbi:hypothetical protein C8J57DRAFT_1728589 [Mycena rebaudengoi]|nr:hypothetical protein C8J57DRAFT_1728589 [Mycena rebaudengoi]